ncbi:asparagine synthetase B family protein [Corallincola holothuriorum]|uniref:asparagine synthase (glutamine-hydrolyzing) n=1 Tax=Corallincola holothuriorum TaxID=2282215 RepID=A0A368NRA2_9GAMM|nr:asparagine synthase C-terminal domain-containing protein [Corallincola holothuriorum]RCU52928.1 asparagine synthetase B family protein [Corallincola holothuriorum]
MSVIYEGDPFAVFPYYYRVGSQAHGTTIAALCRDSSELKLDRQGVLQYLHRDPDGIRTCIEQVHKLTPGYRLVLDNGHLVCQPNPVLASPLPLFDTLASALEQIVRRYSRCGLALSGGFDSALILALLQHIGADNVEVYTLASALPGYCELEITQRTAQHFGVPLRVVEADAEQFVAALPETIAATETPIYNLHPVSKLLLSQAMNADGIDCLITGDAADQVFSGVPSANYLPLVGAIVRSQQLPYHSPFFAPEVVAAGQRVADSNKTALRQLGQNLLPDWLCNQVKQPRLAPDFCLDRYWDGAAVDRLAKSLAIQPDLSSLANRTLWITLTLLRQQLSRSNSCVA